METPFIKKLEFILESDQYSHIIGWANGKTSIEIKEEKEFEDVVLSLHFRHKRMASFVRQLNLYGFRKIRAAKTQTFTHLALKNGEGIKGIRDQKKKNSDEKINTLPFQEKTNSLRISEIKDQKDGAKDLKQEYPTENTFENVKKVSMNPNFYPQYWYVPMQDQFTFSNPQYFNPSFSGWY